jgi:ADP-ribosylglycohydrolase
MSNLKNAIYGFAIGDALGVPYESMIAPECNDMIGYGTHNQPAGTWSDDTSLILATCESMKRRRKIDYDDIMNNFVKWYDDGAFTVDGYKFDVGGITSRAIERYKNGSHYSSCGDNRFTANGNGALMRILPLALSPYYKSYKQIETLASLTHAHNLSIKACQIYSYVVSLLNDGIEIATLDGDNFDEPYDRLNKLKEISKDDIKSTPFVVHTLEAALWCVVNTNNYKDCVLTAVNLGGDTDTIAALAGGLAGLIYGYENIPIEWINKLRGKDIIKRCLG